MHEFVCIFIIYCIYNQVDQGVNVHSTTQYEPI